MGRPRCWGLYQAWAYQFGAWRGIATISGVEDVTGSALNDTLAGDAQNNWLSGGGGNDMLSYTGGFDWLWGDAGNDTASFARLTRPVWVDMLSGGTEAWTRGLTLDTGTWTAAADLKDIENLTGTSYDDYLRGDNAANLIIGGNGNDTMLGEGGNDSMYYTAGLDTFDGGTGTDNTDFSALTMPVWVDLALTDDSWTRGATLQSGTWTLVARLDRVEDLVGTAYDDELHGDSGNNWIQGGGGADLLVYSGGFDWLWGGADRDTASFAPFGNAVWVDLDFAGNEAWTRGGPTLLSGTWTAIADLKDIENVTGTAYDDLLDGNALANTFHGGAGNDVLAGATGSDTLYGDAGADKFLYRSYNELSIGGGEMDTIADFETGIDKIDLLAIDANTTLDGRQSFVLDGSGNPGTATFAAGALYLYVNGIAGYDFTIVVTGTVVQSDLLT